MLLSRTHWVIGSVCALFWLSSALTGAILIPNARYGPSAPIRLRVSPSQALDAATEVADGTPTMLAFPGPGMPAYLVTMRRAHAVVRVEVSPETAKAEIRRGRDFLSWVTDMHQHFTLGAVGNVMLAFSGTCLFVAVISGIGVWGARLARRRRYDAHAVAGLIAVIPLLITSFSGSALALHAVFGGGHRAAHGHADGDDLPDATRAALIAERSVPGERVAQIMFPSGEDAPLTVRMTPGDMRDPRFQTDVVLDAETLAVRKIVTPNARSLSERFFAFAYALHTGMVGGAVTRTIAFLGALTLIFLAGTGVAKARPLLLGSAIFALFRQGRSRPRL